MRVDIIPSALKSFTGKTAVSDIKPVMSEGEILRCMAIGKHGDTVLFANKGYSIFMAKVLGSVNIMPGDNVEMIVSSATNGQYEMEVLDIFPETATSDSADNKQGQQDLNAIVKEGNSKVLATAMNMLKQNPSLKPKEALFLAANKLSGSFDNARVLSNLVQGEAKAGAVLAEILSVIREQTGSESQQETAVSKEDEQLLKPEGQTSKQENTQKPDSQKPEQMPKTDQNTAHKQAVKAEQQSNQPQKQGAAPLEKQNTSKPMAIKQEGIEAPKNNTSSNISEQSKNEIESSTKQEVSSALNKEVELSAKQEIEDTILKMFSKLDSKDRAGNVKKTVADMPDKLKELKILLNNNDSKDKEVIIKAEYLEQQQKFMSDIKRVACYQIPFMMNDQTQNTAELFIYENKNKSKTENGEEFAILVGLDTQYIGRVETLIRFQHKNVSLKFGLENDDTLANIKSSEARLAESIESTGFHLVEMNVSKLEKRTTVLNAEEVLSKNTAKVYENIDVRI